MSPTSSSPKWAVRMPWQARAKLLLLLLGIILLGVLMILWPHEHKVLIRRLAGWAIAILGTGSLGILLIGLNRPLLIVDEEGVHLPRVGLTVTIPWSDIRAITCDAEQSIIHIQVFSPQRYAHIEKLDKALGFQAQDILDAPLLYLPKDQFQQVCQKLLREYDQRNG